MNVEIKINISGEGFDIELSQSEAKTIYEELKLMFEVKETVYIPYVNPLAPTPWQPTPPFYIGDLPYNPLTSGSPHVTYSCGCKNENNS